MSRLSRLYFVGRAGLTALFASYLAGAEDAEAQSESAAAYAQARDAGTIRALENFLEAYPLAPEADLAFRDLVVKSRGSMTDESALPSFGGAVIPPAAAAAAAPAAVGGAADRNDAVSRSIDDDQDGRDDPY